jgi:hypothetical protein
MANVSSINVTTLKRSPRASPAAAAIAPIANMMSPCPLKTDFKRGDRLCSFLWLQEAKLVENSEYRVV